MTETVKVRIAVAVGENGEWAASGWSGALSDGDAVESAFVCCDAALAYHWIEAEIPIPRPTTIPATVSPAEGE